MATTELWQDFSYAVVDVEGNGASPPEIVEIACVVVEAGTIIPEGTSWLVKPAAPISPLVSRIHGIRDSDVADAPPFSDIAGDVLDIVDKRVLVAHNVAVERSVLGRALGDQWHPSATVDTLRLAKAALPGLPRYALPVVAEALGILQDGTGGQSHRALFDATMTARVLLGLIELLKVVTFNELCEIQATKQVRASADGHTKTRLF